MSIDVSMSEISDAEAAMTAQGFISGMENLWVPSPMWRDDEAEAAEPPFIPQYLSALQVFLHFFGMPQRVWIHLAADMQAGKTGVLSALIRLMLTNFIRVSMNTDSIFICTGMSDNDWRKQTCSRMIRDIRSNVFHNKGLTRLAATLRMKAAKGTFANILVAIDESHLAMNISNRPAQQIFDTLRDLCPVEEWSARNIRLLTISATDPASVLAAGTMRGLAYVVPLRTDSDYQSIMKLKAAGRLINTFDLRDYVSVKRLTDFIKSKYASTPNMYHIIRPRPSKAKDVEDYLRALVTGCDIIQWNSTSNAARSAAEVESDSLSEGGDDINTRLSMEPVAPTFIIIKNMFYAAKTLRDRYVGVLHDRIAGKDDTNLQSLAGRACGYGKSERTVVFTTMSTIENYLDVWSKLTARSGAVVDGSVRALHGKMPGVVATTTGNDGDVILHVHPERAFPFRPSDVGESIVDTPFAPAPSTRASNQASECGLEEFPTMDALNARWAELYREKKGMEPSRRLNTPHKKDGIYKCSIGGDSARQTAEAIRRFAVGTRSWGSGITTASTGDLIPRVLVGYEGETPVFFLRWAVKQ